MQNPAPTTPVPVDTPSATPPLVALHIAVTGDTLNFYSIEELATWVASETQGWQWIPKIRKVDGQLQPVAERYQPIFNANGELRTAVESAATRPDVSGQALQRVRTHLETAFNQFRAVPYQSAKGQFVASLEKRDQRIAGHALWFLMGNDPLSTTNVAIRGAVLAASFSESINPAGVQAVQTSLEALNSEFNNTLSKLKGEAAALTTSVTETLGELRTGLGTQKADFDKSQGERTGAFEHELSEARKQIADIRRTVESDLSLRGAVTYWTRKAKSHRNQAWAWGLVSLVAGTAVGITAWNLIYSIIARPASTVNSKTTSAATAAQLPPTPPAELAQIPVLEIALLVIIGTLAFWLLRVLVRLTLSNVHLATDARMRATMMTTYLALLIRGKGELDAKDRQLILSVLFRPSVTGIVKDDATPPGLWDLVTKLLSK